MTDEELINLLPWYINGTLSTSERDAVEGLLERSEKAREEHGFLLSLSRQVASESPQAPSELGWKRLQRDIRAEKQAAAKHASTKQWWKPSLAAAATVMLALQVGFWYQDSTLDNNSRLLSDSLLDNPALLDDNYWVIQVEFNQGSDWERVTAVIDRMQGQIVDGPSSMGLLRIAVPQDNGRFGSSEQLVEWLKQQSSISHAAIEGQ